MSWIKNTSLLLISLIISFGCIELIARFYFSAEDPKDQVHQTYGLNEIGERYSRVCAHGWCAKPGSYKNVTKKIKETKEIIYSVQYTIGKNNLRVTPKINKNVNIHMHYFGGSHVFGEGLNDNETLSYFSQVSSSKVQSENFGFHGHGVHNALRLLQTLEASEEPKGAINLLLTGPYHAFRSACIPSYTGNHPRFEMNDEKLYFKGKCENKYYKGWVQHTKNRIDRINSYIQSQILTIISNYLKSSLTSYQIDLYQNLIREFYELSLERGQRPIVLYTVSPNRNFFTAGYISDPMPDFFNNNGINFINVTQPKEPKFYLHERDGHPTAFANCERVKLIFKNLEMESARLICSQYL
jgi:hypothetical protein